MQNVRFALRMFAKNPGFAVVAILTLALGIGANTAIFSVVNAVMLRPYPFAEPDRIVVVWETLERRDIPYMFAAPPNYADWREQNDVFEEMAAFNPVNVFLRTDREALRLQANRVTASFFPLLQIQPMIGRAFTPDEEGAGRAGVVILGFELWRDRYNRDPNLLGRTLTINDEPHTVIGVMPPSFKFPPPPDLEGGAIDRRSDMWIPYAFDFKAGRRGAHNMRVLARLKSGVTMERAGSDMSAIAQRIAQELPDSNEGWGVTLVPLSKQVLGDIRTSLLALLAAVGFVLLIACLNVANLLLARGAARRREFAVRFAMGAGRGDIARLMLTESLILALLGCGAGLMLASWGVDLLVRIAPDNVPRLDETSIDGAVVAFALTLSLVTGIVFGLIPVFQNRKTDLNSALKEGGRAAAPGRAQVRVRSGLIVAEIALSLVLLAGAGLLFQSFLRLRGVDVGFQPENVLTMSLSFPQSQVVDADQRVAAYFDLEQRLKSIPGVVSAGFVNEIPLAGDRQGTSSARDAQTLDRNEGAQTNFTFATPGFFPAMGISIVRGRNFTDQDKRGAPEVVVVNEALANRLFPNEDAVGKTIHIGFNSQAPREIVGIVNNERHSTLREDFFPGVYTPFFQVPWSNTQALAIRTSGDPAAVLLAVREQVDSMFPMVPIYDVRTMEQVLDAAVVQPRFSSLMLLIFSAAALLLASVGMSGFISFIVVQRTHEIGVRVALGAQRADVLRMILGQGLTLTLFGVGIGIVITLAVGRFVASLLYGVSPADPVTLAGISVFLIAVALAACYFPARRATRVDPITALRTE